MWMSEGWVGAGGGGGVRKCPVRSIRGRAGKPGAVGGWGADWTHDAQESPLCILTPSLCKPPRAHRPSPADAAGDDGIQAGPHCSRCTHAAALHHRPDARTPLLQCCCGTGPWPLRSSVAAITPRACSVQTLAQAAHSSHPPTPNPVHPPPLQSTTTCSLPSWTTSGPTLRGSCWSR